MKFYKETTGRKRTATSERIEADKMYPSVHNFDIEDSIEISENKFIESFKDLTPANASVILNARGCYSGSEIRKVLIKKYL